MDGQANFHTALAIGPSTMERSNGLAARVGRGTAGGRGVDVMGWSMLIESVPILN